MGSVTVPDPAATLILLRPGKPGFEVLMVERNSRGFFGGIVVFPGGAVDEIDRDDSMGPELWARRAAVRELAEEAGILLTRDGAVAGPGLKDRDFYDWIEENAVDTAVDSLLLVSRWVTPERVPRRFDTRFYLAWSDAMPDVRIDTDELVGHSWVTPRAALDR
ncbi:MAG TPA: NUDIX domain-containing protein, partial [Acidimicrobiia bacterium]|nr:NUDIX domain-containing protein [Acidimicrobiia bacterium]